MLNPFLVLAACLVAVPLSARLFGWCYRKIVRRKLGEQVRGSLLLTYDDGPQDPCTSQLADLLETYGVRATFFLLGRRAEASPEACQLLADRMHELGSHSYRHLNAWKVPVWSAIADFRAGVRTLSRWTSPDACYRPPHGKLTLFTWTALKWKGVRLVDWTIDSGDTAGELPDPESIVERVINSDGGVVLLHCHHQDPIRIDFVLRLTRALIEEARRREWRILTAQELYDGLDSSADVVV